MYLCAEAIRLHYQSDGSANDECRIKNVHRKRSSTLKILESMSEWIVAILEENACGRHNLSAGGEVKVDGSIKSFVQLIFS
jgi:hypothetical protein